MRDDLDHGPVGAGERGIGDGLDGDLARPVDDHGAHAAQTRAVDRSAQVSTLGGVRNPHAGVPFTADDFSDAELARHLEDLSVPTLLLVCVHLEPPGAARGDPRRGAAPGRDSFLNEYQGYMSPEDHAAARALALGIVGRLARPRLPGARAGLDPSCCTG